EPSGRAASAAWLRQLFIDVVGNLTPRLVLELGAAEASFSRRIRPLLPKAEVHAFEANPYVHAKYLREAAAAGVRYHNLAVGDRTGKVTFKVGRGRNGAPLSPTKTNNSVLTKSADVEYEDVEVAMTTVDDFLLDHHVAERSCAMWIDVEGLAFEVLHGASAALENTLAVMVEVEDRAFWEGQKLSGEVKAVLFEAGFVPVARDFEYPGQYNVLFVARDSLNSHFLRQALELAYARAPSEPSRSLERAAD
ncbi:MAG TPA: FkbM family methyltransferase, partial [Caulobacteraceae bacterium]